MSQHPTLDTLDTVACYDRTLLFITASDASGRSYNSCPPTRRSHSQTNSGHVTASSRARSMRRCARSARDSSSASSRMMHMNTCAHAAGHRALGHMLTCLR